MLNEEQPENDFHDDAEGLQVDRPLERSRREERARLSGVEEEEQAGDQRRERGRQYPRGQAAPVLEEAADGQRARQGQPADEAEPGHPRDTLARRPGNQDRGQDQDQRSEE